MVEIDKKKLEKILYEIGPSLGIQKEDIPAYIDKIIEKARSSQPIKIPKRGHYITVLKDSTYPLAEFVDGRIRCMYYRETDRTERLYYKWEKELREDELYVIGRIGYATIGRSGVKEIKTDREKIWEYHVSRIQLLVKPSGDYIEILDVGPNPVEIMPYEEFKKRRRVEIKGKYEEDISKLWIIPLLIGLISFPLLIYAFGNELSGFYVLNSSYKILPLSFLAILFVVFILYLRLNKKERV
jgi:hypothetical protein